MANPKIIKTKTIVKDNILSKEGMLSKNGLVIIIGTESSPNLKTGKEYEVSVILAKTLVKKGSANYK